jgi:hypothetical protein
MMWKCPACGWAGPRGQGIPITVFPVHCLCGHIVTQQDHQDAPRVLAPVDLAARLTCPHRSEPIATIPANTAGCGCAGTKVQVFRCQHFQEPVLQRAADRCLDQLCEIVPQFTGRTCRTCDVPTAKPSGLADKLTICLTHYGRPKSLAECLASLDRCYPDVPRIVQDTGGNLSWGRNQAIAQARTPFVMIAEEDYVFTERADLGTLIKVLEADPQIGGASGSVRQMNSKTKDYWYWYANLRRFRGQMQYELPTDWRATPDGTAYVLCDLLPNSGVWRRGVFKKCPWDEDLEVQEHQEWFWRFKCQERYRCAYVPSVSIEHYHVNPTANYKQMRYRKEFQGLAEKKMKAKFGVFKGFIPDLERPNIVVLGVGHSNTSITAQQLHAMGWQAGDADAEFGESVAVRAVNDHWWQTKQFDSQAATQAVQQFTRPWAIKDPRFARGCLHHWLPILAPHQPLLLWVTKAADQVKASYRRRQESPEFVEEYFAYCEQQFALWPWAKLRIDAADIAAAMELWQAPPTTPA